MSTHPDRREILALSSFFPATLLAANGLAPASATADETASKRTRPRKYNMKKSINLWALPYPTDMSLKHCLELCKDAGFDGVELNFDLKGDLSEESSENDIKNIKKLCDKIGIKVSGVCSFLFWPYAFTHQNPDRRKKGVSLAAKMIKAARLLGTENLLVVPGSVYAPWIPDEPSVPHDVALTRATAAVKSLIPLAKKHNVTLNMENIFANGFLHSPQEMNQFVDQFNSKHVNVHFDTGNIMQYHFPEHWIPILGKRIKNIHLKEYSKKVHEFNLNTFRLLLDGTTNWPAVMQALHKTNYSGYLTFEYFNPYPHHPEAIVYHTADSLDRLLGIKS